MAKTKFPSAYTMANYLLKAFVVVLVAIFIYWAVHSMGPLISLVF